MTGPDPHWEVPTQTGIRVGSRVVVREFDGADGLFRDHEGRTVVEDQEGGGTAEGEGPVDWLRDEADAGPGEFQHVATAYRTGTGPLRTVTRLFANYQPGPRAEDGDAFLGPGWVVATRGPFRREDDGVTVPEGAGLPVPFWIGVSGPVTVVREPGLAAVLADAFDVDDAVGLRARAWAVHNGSERTPLTSTFADGRPLTQAVMSHLNEASWQCPVPPGTVGVLLRKTYDRFHGRQRARVLVDGVPVGWWSLPDQDRTHRWACATFGIPGGVLRGRESVRIGIDPPAGTPLWSVARVEAWAVVVTD